MSVSWRSRRARRREYNRYLLSASWRAKRFLVAQRSGGWCERCRRRGKWRRAVEVHHKTYAHIFDERPHELIHLCGPCHDAAHNRPHLDGVAVWVGVVLGVVLGVVWLVHVRG